MNLLSNKFKCKKDFITRIKIYSVIFRVQLYQNDKGLRKDCGMRRNDSGLGVVYIPKTILVWYNQHLTKIKEDLFFYKHSIFHFYYDCCELINLTV
jgi:hypothetical protein